MKKNMIRLIAIFVATLGLVACSSAPKEPKNQETLTSGKMFIGCDESFEPIIEQEIAVFEATYPKATIIPYYVSEEDAFRLLIEDSVRLIIATRPMTEREEAIIAQRNMKVRTVQIAVDAMAFIVNKDNPHVALSVADLQRIVTGEVTRWDQIYKGSKLGDIKFVFDKQGSSSMRYALDSLSQGKPLYQGLRTRRSNQAVIDYVAQTPGAMGVIGATWIDNPADTTNTSFTDKINVLAVRKEAGYDAYRPSQYRIATGEYPLSRPVYVHRTDPKNGLPTGFTTFLSGQKGQLILFKSSMVPWRGEIVLKRDVSID